MPLIPEAIFNLSASDDITGASLDYDGDRDEESMLLTCQKCGVCVHSSMYYHVILFLLIV